MVVRVCREDSRLVNGNGGITLDESGHDTSGGLDTGGKGRIIERILSLLRGITGKNGTLDSSTISDIPIKAYALVGLLAIKEIRNEFDNTRDTRRTAGQTISWMFNLSVLESRRTASTGSRVPRKRSRQSYLKWARVREV